MTRPSRFQPTVFVLSALAAISVIAGAPAAASAQGCTGAPGASAIQQYCEAVPSADGGSDRPGGGSSDDSTGGKSGSGSSNGSRGSSGSDSNAGVSSETSRALDEAGTDGATIERLAGGENKEKSTSSKSTEPATDETSGSEDDGAVLADRVDGPSDPDSSPLKAATNAVASGPTAGNGLAWSLAGLSVAGVAAAVFFRRRGSNLAAPDDES